MKYYTAFIYGEPLGDLHVTHKYLGELTSGQARDIETIVSSYFAINGRQLPRANFNAIEWFGPGRNIRVLQPAVHNSKIWLPSLREILGEFKKDDYGAYRPHVSTADLDEVDVPFNGYALMSGKTIIRLWSVE